MFAEITDAHNVRRDYQLGYQAAEEDEYVSLRTEYGAQLNCPVEERTLIFLKNPEEKTPGHAE